MAGDDEWGPWIEHDGKGCPCIGRFVHIMIGLPWWRPDIGLEDGLWDPSSGLTIISESEAMGPAQDSGSWRWDVDCFPLIRYRIRRDPHVALMKQKARALDRVSSGALVE